jgi:hypothetical protein
MQQDFSKRMIIVVRKDLQGWQIANTIAHVAAYLGNTLKDTFGTGEFFITKDDSKYPRNSQFPIIIKRANSSEQLKNLLGKAKSCKATCHGFIREMIDHTSDAELQDSLALKNDSEVELLGVGVFGADAEVAALTKKFGLWE